MAEGTRSVMLVGVGGQGVVLASNVVTAALLRGGYDVKKSEVHGMAQRGGVVYTHIRFGREVSSPLVPRGTATALVAFEWAEALRWLPYLRPGGTLLASVERVVPPVACQDRRAWKSLYPPTDAAALRERVGDLRLVDARAVAARLGNAKARNSVLLGMLANVLDLPAEAWVDAIRGGVPPRTVEVNLQAFQAGRELTFPAAYPGAAPAPPAPPRQPPRIDITVVWCKGCEICVRVCPEYCLALDDTDRVVALAPDACTGCRLCELLCPDFAIAIRPRELPLPSLNGPMRLERSDDLADAAGGSRVDGVSSHA